jgi:DNA-binding transcriptional LysR family regulator
MDTLDNIRTFLAVVKAGNFSAAARAMDTVPSVIAKRVDQLEHRLKVQLFNRSTRRIELTEIGERYYPRFLQIVTDVDNAFKDVAVARERLEGRLRIKCPTTLTIQHFGDALTGFQRSHPGVHMELVLMDRSVNPLEEGFDIAIGALPSSYQSVIDIPLCPMPRVLVASPAYLERTGIPRHPRDLPEHDCVAFLATGSVWRFETPTGPIDVDVQTSFSVNDSHVLLSAVEKDLGITMMAKHIARESIREGRVVEVLAEFPVPDLWVKALVPENRRRNPAVQAVVEWLIEAAQPVAPWDRIAA